MGSGQKLSVVWSEHTFRTNQLAELELRRRRTSCLDVKNNLIPKDLLCAIESTGQVGIPPVSDP